MMRCAAQIPLREIENPWVNRAVNVSPAWRGKIAGQIEE